MGDIFVEHFVATLMAVGFCATVNLHGSLVTQKKSYQSFANGPLMYAEVTTVRFPTCTLVWTWRNNNPLPEFVVSV